LAAGVKILTQTAAALLCCEIPAHPAAGTLRVLRDAFLLGVTARVAAAAGAPSEK